MTKALALVLVVGALGAGVTPVEKVVTMLKDLQAQVENDGGQEAATYDQYACFCRSKTTEKTESIEELSTSVDSLQADISAHSATRATLDNDINDLNTDLTGFQEDERSAHGMRTNETRTFEMAYADMTKAISALAKAIATLKASKTTDEELVQVKQEVGQAMLVAEAFDISPKKHHAALLKTKHHAGHKAKEIPNPFADDDEVPAADYVFKSGDIIGTLESLHSTFRTKLSDLESDDAAAQSAFDLAAQAKKAQIKASEVSLATKQEEQSAAAEALAVAQADLTASSALLNDDRLYLQDLSANCETKAKEWDQRSGTRADELAAIAQAVSVLETTVAEQAEKTRLNLVAQVQRIQAKQVPAAPAAPEADADEDDVDFDDDESLLQMGAEATDRSASDYVNFLQRRPNYDRRPRKHAHHTHKAATHKAPARHHGHHDATTSVSRAWTQHRAKHPERELAKTLGKEHAHAHAHKHAALVKKVQAVVAKHEATASSQASAEMKMRSRLMTLLAKAGKDLKSPTLAALATKVREDPFAKVKEMVQSLITRLLEEEADEATHKGWCDGELAKTLKDRDYRLKDLRSSHGKVEDLNARKETLTQQEKELREQVAGLTADLGNQTAARDAEKLEHEQTVSDAKAGADAVQQAIDTLSHFYGEAAQNKVEENDADAETTKLLSLRHSVVRKQSPADEAPDSGFSGAYKGSQGASTGILGLLEVIKGDFARSVEETEAAEAQAKRDFVQFERETQVSIATKQTALETTSGELSNVEASLSTEMATLREQQGLLDVAVKTWTELIPQCVVDPGMSHEERTARREAEISALKEAYAILTGEE